MFEFDTPRRRLVGGAAALAVAAGGVLALQPLTASGQNAAAETLTFTAREATFRFFDKPPKGDHPTAGDAFVFTARLRDGGTRVGTLHATCMVTRRVSKPDRTPLLCQGVYDLKNGQLTGQVLVRAGDPVNRIAITGGTGDYLGAAGEAVEEFNEDGTSTVTITLQ